MENENSDPEKRVDIENENSDPEKRVDIENENSDPEKRVDIENENIHAEKRVDTENENSDPEKREDTEPWKTKELDDQKSYLETLLQNIHSHVVHGANTTAALLTQPQESTSETYIAYQEICKRFKELNRNNMQLKDENYCLSNILGALHTYVTSEADAKNTSFEQHVPSEIKNDSSHAFVYSKTRDIAMKFKDLEKAKGTYKQQEDEINRLKKELSDIQRKSAKKEKKNERILKQKEESKTKMATEMAKIQETLNRKSRDLQNLITDHESLKKHCNDVLGKKNRLEGENKTLQYNISHLTNMEAQHRKMIETQSQEMIQMKQEKEILLTRLSKIAGDRLTHDNVNIADLSDAYRPTKLSEFYSEMYDNEWTDAFEELTDQLGYSEQAAIAYLLEILMNTFHRCKEITWDRYDSMKLLASTLDIKQGSSLSRATPESQVEKVSNSDSKIPVQPPIYKQICNVPSPASPSPGVIEGESVKHADMMSLNDLQDEQDPEKACTHQPNADKVEKISNSDSKIPVQTPIDEQICSVPSPTSPSPGVIEGESVKHADMMSLYDPQDEQDPEKACTHQPNADEESVMNFDSMATGHSQGGIEQVMPTASSVIVEKEANDDIKSTVQPPIDKQSGNMPSPRPSVIEGESVEHADMMSLNDLQVEQDAEKVCTHRPNADEVTDLARNKTQESATSADDKSAVFGDSHQEGTHEIKDSCLFAGLSTKGKNDKDTQTDGLSITGKNNKDTQMDGLSITGKNNKDTQTDETMFATRLHSALSIDQEKSLKKIWRATTSALKDESLKLLLGGLMESLGKTETEIPYTTKYLTSCIDLCWKMGVQEKPMHLDIKAEKEAGPEKKFDIDKFRAYTKTGKNVAYVVWPAMFLHEGGAMLVKGIAQGC